MYTSVYLFISSFKLDLYLLDEQQHVEVHHLPRILAQLLPKPTPLHHGVGIAELPNSSPDPE
jgi:hypothetical protein